MRLSLSLLVVLVVGCANGRGTFREDAGHSGMDAGRLDAGPRPDAGGGTGTCTPACGSGTVCHEGVCLAACAPDMPCSGMRDCCGGACVSTQNSTTDCGSCGRRCDVRGNRCVSGTCLCGDSAECSGVQVCCGGRCVDVQTDSMACGRCDNACPSGQACAGGTCQVTTCTPSCDADETCGADGACHCGSGSTCGAQGCCGGECVDTMNDEMNCGRCGMTCSSGQTCVSGSCTTPTCSPSCGPGETCVGGTCHCGTGARCSGGSTCCDGACRNLNSDPLSCGVCGRSCGARSCCNGTCADTQTDFNNCGGCGLPCDSMTADGCSGSRCTCGGGSECIFACLIGMCVPI